VGVIGVRAGVGGSGGIPMRQKRKAQIIGDLSQNLMVVSQGDTHEEGITGGVGKGRKLGERLEMSEGWSAAVANSSR